jgi:hypothetical protein
MPLYVAGLRDVATPQAQLRARYGVDPTIRDIPPTGGMLGGTPIGVRDPYRLRVGGPPVGPLSALPELECERSAVQ